MSRGANKTLSRLGFTQYGGRVSEKVREGATRYGGVCVCGDPLGQAAKKVGKIRFCSPVCVSVDRDIKRQRKAGVVR